MTASLIERDVFSFVGEPTHVRVNLAGWRDRSVVSISIPIGTDATALIDVLERVDVQDVWGTPEPIVSVDGNARLAPLISTKARWIVGRVLRATILLPWTLKDLASVKRHWSSQRAALLRAHEAGQ